MSTTRTVSKNFISLTIADFLNNALAFLAIAYLARVLKADGFGKVQFAQAIMVYFLLVVNQGLSTFGVREIAREIINVKTYTNHILTIRLFLSLISYIILVLFVLCINQSPEIKKLLLIYGFSLFTFSLTLDWVFQGIEKMEYVALGRIINQVIYVSGLFLLVKNWDQLLRVPAIRVVAAMMGAIILGYFFIKRGGVIKLSCDLQIWRQILKQSIPMGVSLIVIQLYYSLDTVILGFMKGVTVVGWYNAAYKIVLLFTGFASLFGIVVFPVLSRCYKESLDQLQKFVYQFSRLTIFFGAPIAVGGMILSDQIIRFVYGSAYQLSILPLQILIWSVFTVYCNCSFAFCLLASDRQKEYMYSVLTGAVVNLTLNLILIPKYSMLGASIATIVSEVITLGLILYYSRRIVKSIPWIDLLKVLGSSFFMGLVLYSFSGNLIIKVFIGIVVYLGAMIILGGIHKEDVKWLKQIIKAQRE
ncbi:MAG: flippase [candidate division Zixibacteria bacterium]|nr:flippase [candidate division Zixibacteria bacterium]